MFNRKHSLLGFLIIVFLSTGCSLQDNDLAFTVVRYTGDSFDASDVIENWTVERTGNTIVLRHYPELSAPDSTRLLFQVGLEDNGTGLPSINDIWYGTQNVDGTYSGFDVGGGRVEVQAWDFANEISGVAIAEFRNRDTREARFWIDLSVID